MAHIKLTEIQAGCQTYEIMTRRGPLKVDGAVVDGFVDFDKRRIVIDDKVEGARFVEVILHEVEHIQYPYLDESVVEQAAKEKTDILSELNLLGWHDD